MAKKTAKKSVRERDERSGDLTEAVARSIAEELKSYAAKIEGLAASMKREGLASVYIDGFSKPKRAMVLLAEYENHVKYRLRESVIRKGQGS